MPTTSKAQCFRLEDTTESKYKVGQVWGYWTRPQEKNSTFVVVKVEKHPTLRIIVHIALRGLKIRRPDGGLIQTVVHVPITETALNASGARLLTEKADLPDYEKDYRFWRMAFDAGKGFVYGPSIAQAVEEMEASLYRNTFPPPNKGENKLLSRSRPYMSQSYHPATNKTEVMVVLSNDNTVGILFPEQTSASAPYKSGVVLASAHYDYEGTTQSARRSVRLVFIAKQKTAYQDPPVFTISVDGKSIHEGEAELYVNEYEDSGRKLSEEWITLTVPVDVFLRVANGKDVEFTIGSKPYKPESFQQKYMRALAKVIEP